MHDSTIAQAGSRFTQRLRVFNLIFVPLLMFSLAGQIAVVWTQLADIRDGYFDFVLYHTAARIIADGKGTQLYDLTVQKNYQKDTRVAPQTRPLPFNHLPYELLALLPLAQLSFAAAHLVWAAMNLALLLAILFRLAPFVTAPPRYLTTLMFFAFFPTLTALKMGQDSLITTYILVETFISLKHRRYALAGCLLALGLYKPQFVLPIAAILLCHRRWHAIGGFLLTAAILMGISLALVGWQGLTGLLALWLPMTERGNVVWPELMLNLRGLLYVMLNIVGMTSATNLLTLVISLLVFFVTLRCWRRDADEIADGFELQFALAVVMTALVSFHLYSYDGMLLAIPLVLMFNHVLKAQLRSPTQRLFLPLLIVMFLPLLPNALLGYAVLAWWALPVPLLFGIIAWEIGDQSKLTPAGVRN
jgi:hypothetical protein